MLEKLNPELLETCLHIPGEVDELNAAFFGIGLRWAKGAEAMLILARRLAAARKAAERIRMAVPADHGALDTADLQQRFGACIADVAL